MAYLIDTDIIIYSLKNNIAIHKWMIKNQNVPKYISIVTYGELIYGARKSKHPEKNLATANRIAELFPIVDINKSVMEIFGEIKAKLENIGSSLADMDLLIAATSMYMNLSLVTNNKKHFNRIDDLILEDWENN